MKLFAIPIVKNRLCYYCHSTLPTSSRLTQLVNWSNKKWEEFGDAKEDSWKKKLYGRGNDMMNKLDYQEWFLKGVPTREHIEVPPDKVITYHPSSLTPADIERDLATLLHKKGPYHEKYMKYSAYFVPLSCTFVIVPLIPNIPLAYNLFRLYSHYKAYKGAQFLEHLIDDKSLEYQTCKDMDDILHSNYLTTAQDIVFPERIVDSYKATAKLNSRILEDDIPGVLNKRTISALAKHYDVPALELELLRARSQLLTSIFLEQHKNHK